MTKCSAINCKNKGVHMFPKDPTRRKQWENALRIKNFKASDSSRLCAGHFNENDYFGRSKYTDLEPRAKFLKKTAVPSKFFFTKIKPETPAALERQRRLDNRSKKKLSQIIELLLSEPITSKNDGHNINLTIGREEEICEIKEEIGEVKEQICEVKEQIDVLPTEVQIAIKSDSKSCSSKYTQVDREHMFGSIDRYKDDDKSIQFYTGFESYKKFHLVYSTLSPMAHKIRYYGSCVQNLSTENQFFMTLMKLRQNKCNFELGKFYNVSKTTVSNIFITWVNFIYQLWSQINVWPSKELVNHYMPENFKKYDENTRVILDGTEEAVQKSNNPTREMVREHDVHMERIKRLAQTYKILKFELDHSFVPIASKIFYICFMCCNFRESTTSKNNKAHQ